MRSIKYISPTSFGLFKKSPEDFYMRYLSEAQVIKEPQTIQMAIGSAFDYYVKTYLNKKLKIAQTPLVLQIDNPALKDEATVEGNRAFDFYQDCGALASLMLEISHSARFEFSITKVIEGVPLSGKPDAFFATKANVPVILDWKVNGWLAERASPKAGYLDCFPNRKQHKDAMKLLYKDIFINANGCEDMDWATQLTTYAWLLGTPVGVPFVGGIDQIVGPRAAPRVAKHRFLISEAFQIQLIKDYRLLWQRCTGELPLFDNMTPEQIKGRCAALDKQLADPTGLREVQNPTW